MPQPGSERSGRCSLMGARGISWFWGFGNDSCTGFQRDGDALASHPEWPFGERASALLVAARRLLEGFCLNLWAET